MRIEECKVGMFVRSADVPTADIATPWFGEITGLSANPFGQPILKIRKICRAYMSFENMAKWGYEPCEGAFGVEFWCREITIHPSNVAFLDSNYSLPEN